MPFQSHHLTYKPGAGYTLHLYTFCAYDYSLSLTPFIASYYIVQQARSTWDAVNRRSVQCRSRVPAMATAIATTPTALAARIVSLNKASGYFNSDLAPTNPGQNCTDCKGTHCAMMFPKINDSMSRMPQPIAWSTSSSI